MTRIPKSVHQLLRRQHGVVSRGQLLNAGLTSRQVDHLASRGDLAPALKGAYRSPSVPISGLGRCAEVCLARPATVVAGPTAGQRWGLRHVDRHRPVYVITPPAANPAIAPWVIPYRTAAIDLERDVIQRSDGIRLTSPARTALDLTRFLTADQLLSVIEQVMSDHGVTERDLRSVAADWVSPGRPWIKLFFRQLGRRLPGGPAESNPEIKVANGLRRRGVRGLSRQHELTLPGYGPARFDLAVPKLRWAIEVDVFSTHTETIGVHRDEQRDEAAEADGWTVSRLTASDYENRLSERLDELAAQHHERRRSSR